MKESDDRMWIEACRSFDASGLEKSLLPIYADIYREVVDYASKDIRTDVIDQLDELMEKDDPESGTWRLFIDEKTRRLMAAYCEQLGNFHSRNFAQAYVSALIETCENPNESCSKAYRILGSRGGARFDLDNPQYAEAYLWALRSGKGSVFAEFFARMMVDGECAGDVQRLLKAAELYARSYSGCLKNGKSEIYSLSFSEQMTCGISAEFASIHAERYERKLLEGYSHIDAWHYAHSYMDERGKGRSLAEEEDDLLE